MDIRPIRKEDDHRAALEATDALWGAAEGTPEGDRLDVLVTLVAAYEARRWPVEAIEAAMACEGRSRGDLAELIGQSRATEILHRRRPLTLPMIRKIAAARGCRSGFWRRLVPAHRACKQERNPPAQVVGIGVRLNVAPRRNGSYFWRQRSIRLTTRLRRACGKRAMAGSRQVRFDPRTPAPLPAATRDRISLLRSKVSRLW